MADQIWSARDASTLMPSKCCKLRQNPRHSQVRAMRTLAGTRYPLPSTDGRPQPRDIEVRFANQMLWHEPAGGQAGYKQASFSVRVKEGIKKIDHHLDERRLQAKREILE